ncbi:hypothetical protein A1O7_02394 [Cladophialophora yegresii CBS 114405]|uniref:DUF4149 domain-containing protein n=1 Tax=Cladophialophora yegresii CBS 114405 TaxID=1182544 RepID=W9W1K5_9EURO|nr:uncharacterized protein A1O7_02394 [Cladophialophora yegresii CBS 114405]EXJ61962.1 hypothetical protein A1O7_02394 [Cladophialophora yegresii CBS 114405]
MNTVSVAKFVGVPAALLLGGYHFSLSHNIIPVLYGQPASVALSAFTPIYMTALTQVFLPAGFLSLTSFGTLTYKAENTTERFLYGTAAAMIVGFGVVTKFVIVPVAERLMFFEETTPLGSKFGGNDEVVRLLKAFTSHNWFRVVFALGAGLIALYAVMTTVDERAHKSLL